MYRCIASEEQSTRLQAKQAELKNRYDESQTGLMDLAREHQEMQVLFLHNRSVHFVPFVLSALLHELLCVGVHTTYILYITCHYILTINLYKVVDYTVM